MSTIQKRIDFMAIVSVDGANPNGDPNADNQPRMDFRGLGEMTDVCIKHKLRRRLQAIVTEQNNLQAGNEILIPGAAAGARRIDTINKRLADIDLTDFDAQRVINDMCGKFRDVRAFGFLWAAKVKGDDDKKTKSLSIGLTGPVSVQTAKSVAPINVIEVGITKSMSMDEANNESDTMGTKYRVDAAAYVIKGSISVYEAEKTGLNDEDVLAIKEALQTLFEGDASAARPAGTMIVQELHWFKHNTKAGKLSPAKVYSSVKVESQEAYPYFVSTCDDSMLAAHGVTAEHIVIG